jgi:UDP-N-acetylmuramate: L-alanyl-gamma-D-glutamyl-meso-diaminopimelate ligase
MDLVTMGVDEAEFCEANASFKGASKRLEKSLKEKESSLIKILLIGRVRLSATTKAVKKSISRQNISSFNRAAYPIVV